MRTEWRWRRETKLWGKKVFVNPRPHLGRWVEAVLAQAKMEGAEKIVLGCVVRRERVQAGRDVCLALPVLYPLFHSKGVVAKAWGMATRPGVRRVPEQGVKLPPVKWEEGFLSAEEALVLVEVTPGDGVSRSELEWDAAEPPRVESGMEEMVSWRRGRGR